MQQMWLRSEGEKRVKPGPYLVSGQWSERCSYVENIAAVEDFTRIPYCDEPAAYWLTFSNGRTFPACAEHAAWARRRPTFRLIANRMPETVS